MNNRITTGVVVGFLLLTTQAFSADNKDDIGKELFNNSECSTCHSTDIFTKEDRKVGNLEELEAKVRLCDSQLSVNWFDEEIKDVVSYLNKEFYKFKEKEEEE